MYWRTHKISQISAEQILAKTGTVIALCAIHNNGIYLL